MNEITIKKKAIDAERERTALSALGSAAGAILRNPILSGIGGVVLVQYLNGHNYNRKTGGYHTEAVTDPLTGMGVHLQVEDTEPTPFITNFWAESLEAMILLHMLLRGLDGVSLPQAVAAGEAVAGTVGNAIGAGGRAVGGLASFLGGL